jgi:ribonucleoside-diphosphate reductase alpha chain
LCTEILEVTSDSETAVCNLGSINLARHVAPEGFDFEKLARTVHVAVRQLDRVIDLNYYPIQQTKASNSAWRPWRRKVSTGIMGRKLRFTPSTGTEPSCSP